MAVPLNGFNCAAGAAGATAPGATAGAAGAAAAAGATAASARIFATSLVKAATAAVLGEVADSFVPSCISSSSIAPSFSAIAALSGQFTTVWHTEAGFSLTICEGFAGNSVNLLFSVAHS